MEDIKRPNDLVLIVNVTGQGRYTDDNGKEHVYEHHLVTLNHDGNPFTIDKEAKNFRHIAEHLRKMSVSYAEKRHWLKIVELPADQRNIETAPSMMNEVVKLEGEKQDLAKENELLRLQIKNMQSETPEPEKRKPGRPSKNEVGAAAR